VETIQPALSNAFTEFLGWADERRSLGVRANADTPEDATKAREFGAQVSGSCAPSICSSRRSASRSCAR
jgi:pyruvate,orthophosphate dikinase